MEKEVTSRRYGVRGRPILSELVHHHTIVKVEALFDLSFSLSKIRKQIEVCNLSEFRNGETPPHRILSGRQLFE